MRRPIRSALVVLAALLAGSAAARAEAVPDGTQAGGFVTPASTGAAGSWPHVLHRPEADVTIYQPQAESWPDHKRLTARAAVAIAPKQGQPVLGSIEISLATEVDAATGVVHLSDPKLIASHFPSLDTARAGAVQARIEAALPDMNTRQVPLAAVLLSLDETPAPSVALDDTPPRIFHASRPASLVVFDGEPVLAPVGKTGLQVVVNTNWEVFRAATAAGERWYLLNDGIWLTADRPEGPWAATGKLPEAFKTLPADASYSDARRAVPARLPPPSVQVPTIFVSKQPADIVVTDGPPKFAAIPGIALRRVTNTASALFLEPGPGGAGGPSGAGGTFYLLLAGRWFASESLDGPWRFATGALPADFALIPPIYPGSAVLAAVPGTAQAEDAVLKAQIPHTATLARDSKGPAIVYAGAPDFQPIPGTSIAAAANTHATVLRIGAKYYACVDAAWWVAPSPQGPWTLAEAVPAEVRTIPPTSPYYNVTYVQVYGATPQAVTFGYTSGYVLGFVSAGVLVYGTGYYYPPVVVPGPVPIYYPRPYTYAGSVYYNPATGAWVRGGSVWGPYYGAAAARGYNPATGAWGRGGVVYGPYGGAGAWSYYNPSTGSYARGTASWSNGSGVANASFYNGRTGVAGSTTQNWSPYGRQGSSSFAGPNQTVNTRSAGNANGVAGGFSSSTGAEGAGYHNRVTGSSGGAVKTQGGDVYAGRDGNVYRNTGSGWSKWSDGGWNPVTPPSSNRSSNRSTNSTSSANPNRSSGTVGASSGSSGTRSANRAGSTRSTQGVDTSSWRQLQQDRLGRQFGSGQYGQGRSGSAQNSNQYRRGRFQR